MKSLVKRHALTNKDFMKIYLPKFVVKPNVMQETKPERVKLVPRLN